MVPLVCVCSLGADVLIPSFRCRTAGVKQYVMKMCESRLLGNPSDMGEISVSTHQRHLWVDVHAVIPLHSYIPV